MNFTREPIIETIITPKEGNKLLVRNSKREIRDDYLVDAIEVVSFGQSIFYRSLERPKSFIVPVSDYEVVEVKETRLALKSATIERSIKIGGGRSAPRSATKENAPPEEEKEERPEKKRERRKRSRRRGAEEKETREERAQPPAENQEEKKRISRLLPPPPTLIAQTIGKYREAIHPEAPPLPDLTEHEEEKKPESTKKESKKREEEKPSDEPPPEGKDDKSSFWGLFS